MAEGKLGVKKILDSKGSWVKIFDGSRISGSMEFRG